jgi:hypothetical protein
MQLREEERRLSICRRRFFDVTRGIGNPPDAGSGILLLKSITSGTELVIPPLQAILTSMKSVTPAKSGKPARAAQKIAAADAERRATVDWKAHHRHLKKLGCRPGTLADVARINAVIAGEA